MPEGTHRVSRVELTPADLDALQYAADTIPDLDCRARLRGIRKRAALARTRGDLGDESLPGVGRLGDLAALLIPTPTHPSRTRTPH